MTAPPATTPPEPLTRATAATLLHHYAGRPPYQPPPTSPFTDLNPDDNAYPEICWTADQTIAYGVKEKNGAQTYRPHTPVTRATAATLLHRFKHRYRNKDAEDAK